MSKEIIKRTWCDNHERQGIQEPGEERRIDLGNGPRALDLCDPCDKELLEPLRELLGESGQPVLTPPAQPKKKLTREDRKRYRATKADYNEHFQTKDGFACPLCTFVSKSKTYNALYMHVQASHRESLADILAERLG